VLTGSLADVTRSARVEPLTIVSKDLVAAEYTPDVMQTVLSIFTGYYLQAVALTSKVDGIQVIKVLDQLNPNRDDSILRLGEESAVRNVMLTVSGHKYKLPSLESWNDPLSLNPQPNTGKTGIDIKLDEKDETKELVNLAVGKLINVSVTNNDQSVTIPVNFRLSTTTMPNQSIAHLLTTKNSDEDSFIERWHSWRSGRIEFIKDLILAQDLIDQHKKALMQDEQGVYAEILNRITRAKKAGFITATPSLAAASNIFVVSTDVIKEVETKLSGKMSKASTRKIIFDATYAMLIVVVDKEWERVTIYTRGIEAATEVSIKEIKMANKGKGVDPMDVLKALNQGNAPSF
jgi:hypothetical protein